jgi:hypothetical protein
VVVVVELTQILVLVDQVDPEVVAQLLVLLVEVVQQQDLHSQD